MAQAEPAAVSVRLLGPPRIEREGRAVPVDTRKAIALLAYLAYTGHPTGRDRLAALLWPEADQSHARASLRRTLSVLNTALAGRGLRIERELLALEPGVLDVDLEAFRESAAAGDAASLRAAAETYRGDFLAGFGLRDSAEFDDWQLAAATDLRRLLAGVLERLTAALSVADPDAAIGHARRWLELDPLQEAAHRALIRLHTNRGDRAAAARQYRECVDLLARELGVEPGAETTEVYRAAQAGPGGPDRTGSAALHELMGDLLTLQGRYGEAERSYETAMALGGGVGEVKRKTADLYQRRGDYVTADRLYAEAADSLRPGQAGDRARVLADWSVNAHRSGDAGRAADLAARALAEAETSADTRARAQAHNIAGMLSSRRGDLGEARRHLETSLRLAEELDDPVATAASLNNLALALDGADVERALQLAERALDLCVRVGDRHREAAMHSNLADLLRAAGRDDEARRHLRMSAAIFAEIGENGRPQPEIWKLVEW